MDAKRAKADAELARIAARQHGVVSVRQLREADVSRDALRRRVEKRQLHRIFRGVYAVGHRGLSVQGRWMAAVLASGGTGTVARLRDRGDRPYRDDPGGRLTVLGHWGAAISHRSAAELWGLLSPADGPIDVSVLGDGGKRKRRGIRVHRSLTLSPAQVTLRHGIPVTTPARTIADLRRVVSKRGRPGPISPWELRRANREAEVAGLPLDAAVEGDGTRSDLESGFLHLCRRFRLPAPEVNVRVGPYLVDFLWRDRDVVVETDGYEYHRGRQAFQDDRDRDLDLRAGGFQVIHLSEKQVNEEPRRVAEVVSAALRVGADG